MLADAPQMTWFADIKLLLWRFADKTGSDARALIPRMRRREDRMTGSGTNAKCHDVRCTSALGGKAEVTWMVDFGSK
jgi:hypothetical protein